MTTSDEDNLGTVTIEVKVTAQDLVGGASHDDLFQLVCDLDEAAGTWDFTLRLFEYFDGRRMDFERKKRLGKAER